MPPPSTPQPSDDNAPSPSDLQWLQQLAGRPATSDDAQAAREALALRRALMQEPEAPTVPGTEAGLQRLLHALRDAHLLPRHPARPPANPFWQRWRWPAAVVAAALAVVMVWAPPWRDTPEGPFDEPPQMRGEVPQLELRRTDPSAFAAALQRDLAGAGAAARVYRQRESVVIDIDMPPEALEQARPIVAAAGVPAVAGLTRVTVRP